VALVILPSSLANSQSGSSSGGSGLSITPTRFEFVIERGKTDKASIQVKNVTERPILAKVFLNDFEPDGNTGNPKLIVDANQAQSSNSIKEFVSDLTDFNLDPGATAVVDVPIQIPENAAPGAYYGAIRFQSALVGSDETADNTPQVSLNASVAALILIEVPGDITERIEISSVSAYLNDKKGVVFTKKPTQSGIEVNNLGNGFSKPFGRVSVKGPWGKGEVHAYELNDTAPRGNVLPKSKRLFLDELKGVSLPGRYTIEANISHGRGGEVLTVTSTFWYLPAWLLIALALLVVVMVWLAFYLYRKYVTKSVKRAK
jgi:hypothetical protein